MTLVQDISAAAPRIAPFIRRTPLAHSASLSKRTGVEVYLKLENYQITGSFKARGAMNRLQVIHEASGASGVVAASSGNHGMAVAWAARTLGLAARVCVPEVAVQSKIDRIRGYGAEVIVHGADCVDAEAHARTLSEADGLPYVSPYNDYDVMCGQGTAGVEIADQADAFDSVYVAMGGGGLIGGVGAYLKAVSPNTRMVGCSPSQSPALHECLEAKTIIDVPCHSTISDATAGGVESGAVTFPVCQEVVDESLLLDEAEIKEAFRGFMADHPMLIEGAAAVTIAGFLQSAGNRQGSRVCILLCGANIGTEKLGSLLAD